MAMICSNLASIGNLNIIGGLYISQSKIYDGAFIAKIVKGHLKSTFAQDSRVLTLPLPPCSSLFVFEQVLVHFLLKMCKENNGQCKEKKKKLCKVKRAGESNRTPFIDKNDYHNFS